MTGLTEQDFQLFENGRRLPIRAFTAIRVPSASDTPVAPNAVGPVSDVTSNQMANSDGRIVVIMMDRSIPPEQPTIEAHRIATAAIEALGPHDVAAVVSSSGAVPQNLTADRSRLLRTLQQRDWSTGQSKAQEDVGGKDDPLSDGRCLCGLCVLETITRVADSLQQAQRRSKVLLFIGASVILQEGPRAPSADIGCERRLADARRKLDASLALSHLTIHSIDPTGLSSVGPQTRASSPGGKPGEDRFAKVMKQQSEMTGLLKEQGSLEYLPELTGGRVVRNTNAPAATVPDIFAESSTYYVLGFEPIASNRSLTSGSIQVKVSRPGAHVYAQRKYTLPINRPTSASLSGTGMTLAGAVSGLLPNPTRPLTLSASATAGEQTDARVVVNVNVGSFAEGASSRPLRFVLAALTQGGRVVKSATQTAPVVFNTGAAEDGIVDTNIQTSVDLSPGDYEIRMGVEDPSIGTIASAFTQLTVPDFPAAAISVSDVIIQASGTSASGTNSAPITVSPTTRRMFGRKEVVRGVFRVYQGTRRTSPLGSVTVRNAIIDAAGRAVREQSLSISPSQFEQRTAALSVNLDGLDAGAYVLSVEASGMGVTARRQLPFWVR